MSIFATLYATEPASPQEALRMAFPGATVVEDTPPRVTTMGVDASSWVPSQPNFHEDLSAAVRSFLGSSRGDVALCYLDEPILKRDAGGACYQRSHGDFVDGPEWKEVSRVEIPRDQAGKRPASGDPAGP